MGDQNTKWIVVILVGAYCNKAPLAGFDTPSTKAAALKTLAHFEQRFPENFFPYAGFPRSLNSLKTKPLHRAAVPVDRTRSALFPGSSLRLWYKLKV